jgi:molecular chaperone GrpE
MAEQRQRHREGGEEETPMSGEEVAGEPRAGEPAGERPFRPGNAMPSEDDAAARIDQLLRALADAENARRRAERTAAEARQYAIGDFARDLLIVADNLERALKTAGESASGAIIEGVAATHRQLMQVLERYGVCKIESLRHPFDPKLHEAVMVIDDHSREPGQIVDVVEDGYTLRDRLLRPARVVVNNPHLRPADNLHGQEPG